MMMMTEAMYEVQENGKQISLGASRYGACRIWREAPVVRRVFRLDINSNPLEELSHADCMSTLKLLL
jgi:hypothetical protein